MESGWNEPIPHLANAVLDLMLVPSLWPLAKVSDHTEASHCTSATCRPLRFIRETLQLGLALVSATEILSWDAQAVRAECC